MKERRSVGGAVCALIAVLMLAQAVSAQSKSQGWPVFDKVDALTRILTSAGFSLQQGELTFGDLILEVCEGRLPDTLANNPWPNTYILMRLGPHPGVTPLPTDLFWQLGPNEAILLVGQTPPPAAFFSYQTFVINPPGSPERIGVPVGDSVNIGTVRTMGPDPYEQPIVYIVTGHRGTERAVHDAALRAGYPQAIINVERISPIIAPMVIGNGGSWFAFGHRVAVSLNDPQNARLKAYAQAPPYKVFRLTPGQRLASQLGDDPEPVPVLRPRGTGRTEMDLYPALQRLRRAILGTLESSGYGEGQRQELDTKSWSLVTNDPVTGRSREMIVEKPYVGLQRGVQVLGATRDTNYLATFPNIRLREGVDEFAIAYGVNHQKAGKVTYSSVSVYADKDRWFGGENGTMTSPSFGDSARHYLPDDPDADLLYAIKVARNCNGEEHCLEVRDPTFLDIYGAPYKVNPTCMLPFGTPDAKPWKLDEQEVFFLFRSYMEPATKVGPDDNELLYDRAVYFKR